MWLLVSDWLASHGLGHINAFIKFQIISAEDQRKRFKYDHSARGKTVAKYRLYLAERFVSPKIPI